MNCPRCKRPLFGSSLYCVVHGDQADIGPIYVGDPDWRTRSAIAGEERCPNCEEAFSRYGLRNHLRVCAVQAEMAL